MIDKPKRVTPKEIKKKWKKLKDNIFGVPVEKKRLSERIIDELVKRKEEKNKRK